MTKEKIFEEIAVERVRQEIKWGQQNHKLVGSTFDSELHYGIINEEKAKLNCENAVALGNLRWAHIIVEELSEALHANSVENMRKELIETAACCVAAIESLDRNGK